MTTLNTEKLNEKDQHALELVTGLIASLQLSDRWESANYLLVDLLHTEPYCSTFYNDLPFIDISVINFGDTAIVLESGVIDGITSYIKDISCGLDDLPDDYEFDEPGETRENIHVQFTIGITWEKFGRLYILKQFGCQSGDNSYTGAAYFHPHWGVGTITSEHQDFNKAFELIEEMILQSLEQFSI